MIQALRLGVLEVFATQDPDKSGLFFGGARLQAGFGPNGRTSRGLMRILFTDAKRFFFGGGGTDRIIKGNSAVDGLKEHCSKEYRIQKALVGFARS